MLSMKSKLISLGIGLCLLFTLSTKSQTTTIAPDYKMIDMGGNGVGDYGKSLILLHQIYNGTPINQNYAVGTIMASRGTSASFGRINIAHISTYSAYDGVAASFTGLDGDGGFNAVWKLKTCMYIGKKYLALEVPYSDAYHDQGYKFIGFTKSTAESMKAISYEKNGLPINTNLVSNIQNFNANLTSTNSVEQLYITGSVGIGIANTNGAKLAVNGNIHAQQVTIDMKDWADYVFKEDHRLMELSEVEKFVLKNRHLPEIPSESQILTQGLDIGEMNKLLLKKVEELTLYLIEQNKKISVLEKKLDNKL